LDASWQALPWLFLRGLAKHPWRLGGLVALNAYLGVPAFFTGWEGGLAAFLLGQGLILFVIAGASGTAQVGWLGMVHPWLGPGAALALGLWAVGGVASALLIICGLPIAVVLAIAGGVSIGTLGVAYLQMGLFVACWVPWLALPALEWKPVPALAGRMVPLLLAGVLVTSIVSTILGRGSQVPLLQYLTPAPGIADLLGRPAAAPVTFLGVDVGPVVMQCVHQIPFGLMGFLALARAVRAPAAAPLGKPFACVLGLLLCILLVGGSARVALADRSAWLYMAFLAGLAGAAAAATAPSRDGAIAGFAAARRRGLAMPPPLRDRASNELLTVCLAVMAAAALLAPAAGTGRLPWREALDVAALVLAIGWAAQARRLAASATVRALVLLGMAVAGILVLLSWLPPGRSWQLPGGASGALPAALALAAGAWLAVKLRSLRAAAGEVSVPSGHAPRGSTPRTLALLLAMSPPAALVAWPRLRDWGWLPPVLIALAIGGAAMLASTFFPPPGVYFVFSAIEGFWIFIGPALLLRPPASPAAAVAEQDELRLVPLTAPASVLGGAGGHLANLLPSVACLAAVALWLAGPAGVPPAAALAHQALLFLLVVFTAVNIADRPRNGLPIFVFLLPVSGFVASLGADFAFTGMSFTHFALMATPTPAAFAGDWSRLWGLELGTLWFAAVHYLVFGALLVWATVAATDRPEGPGMRFHGLLACAIVGLWAGAAWGGSRPEGFPVVVLATLCFGLAATACATHAWRPVWREARRGRPHQWWLPQAIWVPALVAAGLLLLLSPGRQGSVAAVAVAGFAMVTGAALLQVLMATRAARSRSPAVAFLLVGWLLPWLAGGIALLAGAGPLARFLFLLFPGSAIWLASLARPGPIEIAMAVAWAAGCAAVWLHRADRMVRTLQAAPGPPEPPPGVVPRPAPVAP